MTRDEAIRELQTVQEDDDTEIVHLRADEILCELLRAAGFADVVAEYEKVDKWYA